MSSKNIWYISKYIAPAYAAKVAVRGFMLLKEFDKLGCKSVLITSDSNHLATPPCFNEAIYSEVVDGVDVFWLKTVKYKKANSLLRILSWFDFELQLFKMKKKDIPKPDFIIVSSLSLLTVLNGIYLSRKYNCKFIFEVRDIWPMVLIETAKYNKNNPFILFLKYIEKLAYKKADLIVGTMPNLRQHVYNSLGFEKPVVCIPQGVDYDSISNFKPLSEDYVAKYLSFDGFVVCYAGTIGADNSLDTLIRCAKLMDHRDDVNFIIVGDGYLKDHYMSLALGLKNIKFLPRVDKQQVQSLLSHADLLYFSAPKSETFNYGQSLNKVIDYMFSGKPIVASYSGYPSMLNDSGCGVYVPAENELALKKEIEKILSMLKPEREIMGLKGKEWLLENQRFEILAKKYLNYMDSL